jgi:ubiquinone/menaquinone biosynthesis C-methylase UbiE
LSLSLDRQNAYREQYRARKPGWRPATEIYEASIRRYLAPGLRLIDIGCGRGGVLEQVADATADTLGFDPDLPSLREHRLPSLRRAQALAHALPLRNASADIAICSWVFEHLVDPVQTFGEVTRVLRPGGRFIFLTPNARSVVALLNRGLRPLQKILVPLLYGRAETDTFPVQYRANTQGHIAALATRAGLSLVSLEQIEDPTYFAFAPMLFHLSIALSSITPPVHLVGVLQKT